MESVLCPSPSGGPRSGPLLERLSSPCSPVCWPFLPFFLLDRACKAQAEDGLFHYGLAVEAELPGHHATQGLRVATCARLRADSTEFQDSERAAPQGRRHRLPSLRSSRATTERTSCAAVFAAPPPKWGGAGNVEWYFSPGQSRGSAGALSEGGAPAGATARSCGVPGGR